MALNLPPDPYNILGVSKDAQLPEIRSAHRKLVLKCHPDKVQDPTLKAIKQDEFQKVQQAYEILSDDNKRIQYDENVKLFELRKEMGRGNPTARSNPFEYEIKTAEPRSPYSRPAPRPDVYPTYSPPKPHEEDIYEIPIRTAKKSSSYEIPDSRRKPSTRETERERRAKYEEDDKLRERREKESKRAAHDEKKKSRDKEKRRGTEDKHSRAQVLVESDDEDYRHSQAKKSSRHRDDDARMRTEAAYKSPHISPTAPSAPLTPKWENHKQFAADYMTAANKKHAPQASKDEFHAPPLRRAETYNVRNVTPQTYHISSTSDDDLPRRSSGRTTRRSSEDPVSRSNKDSKKDHKRSPSTRTREKEPHINIVEPPSPPPPMPSNMRMPKLHSHTSAPPLIPVPHLREKPSRSKTQDYPRQEQNMPPLPRAQTFQSGDRDRGRGREKSSSKSKAPLNFDTDSEPEPPHYASPRLSHSPQRRREPPPTEHKQTRYFVESGRTVPLTSRHREELRNLDDDSKYARDRSPSPRSGRDRPPLSRNAGGSHSRTRQMPQRSQSQSYYAEVIPDVRTVHPSPPRKDHYFGEVSYAQPLTREKIVFTSHAPLDSVRRGSDPTYHHHRGYPEYPPTGRGVREAVYT